MVFILGILPTGARSLLGFTSYHCVDLLEVITWDVTRPALRHFSLGLDRCFGKSDQILSDNYTTLDQ